MPDADFAKRGARSEVRGERVESRRGTYMRIDDGWMDCLHAWHR